jgi:hypothetical protein
MMWNEGQDLPEWLEFHRLAGMEHVYLYDDGSTDDGAEIVRPYVSAGFVTFIPWARFSRGVSIQRLVYAHALCTFGPDWRWMAFIDLDEYLFAVKDESLGSALSRFDDLPAIVVPWHMFGFCGHDARPPGLVIENFTRRMPFPPPPKPIGLLNWKSIVDPLAVAAIDSPHLFILSDGRRGGYNEDRTWIEGQRPEDWERARSEVLRLNHYFTKSRETFNQRRSAGRSIASGRAPERHRDRALRYAMLIENGETVDDDLILRFAPALNRILADRLSSHSDRAFAQQPAEESLLRGGSHRHSRPKDAQCKG